MTNNNESNEPGFSNVRPNGFHITFENGWTVSVQWGWGTYSDNGRKDFDVGFKVDSVINTPARSLTAEIAAWGPDGNWYQFESDTVLGWQSPEEVAAFIIKVAAFPRKGVSKRKSL